MTTYLTGFLEDAAAGSREILLGALLVTVAVLALAARKIRTIARSERPDEPLAAWAMLIGLGWSSEAIWEITRNRLHFALGLTLLLFVVNELALVLSMLRAKRHQLEHGWPGQPGQTAWGLAVLMAIIAGSISHSAPEAILRAAIPIVVTKLWWDGMVPGKRPGATSWRWTPRTLLVWIGAIQPGEHDIETVHRERLTRQLVNLEFRRQHGAGWLTRRRAGRLARLSLVADDAMIDEARARLGRATWFEAAATGDAPATPVPGLPDRQAKTEKQARLRHRRQIRTLRLKAVRRVVVAAQTPRKDDRVTEDVDLVIRAVQAVLPGATQNRIARLAATSESTVRRANRRNATQQPTATKPINGAKPDLVGAGTGEH
ncbi:hypothetical protein [Actinoplanes sp. NPDC051851]|uniref:hypothetical protein n=1 Tax=Actinoplanes sp. NPDC051851 TaxID=3154753 RepID=UPI00342A5AE3